MSLNKGFQSDKYNLWYCEYFALLKFIFIEILLQIMNMYTPTWSIYSFWMIVSWKISFETYCMHWDVIIFRNLTRRLFDKFPYFPYRVKFRVLLLRTAFSISAVSARHFPTALLKNVVLKRGQNIQTYSEIEQTVTI